MRIIAGIHKGRKISSAAGTDVRPTTGRTREALFSILSSGQFLEDGQSILQDARVLDICCGTGTLGLESLSRGAAHVTFIDRDGENLHAVKTSADAFDELRRVTLVRADVTSLPSCHLPYALVFLDPPYYKGLVLPTLKGLISRHWLIPGAVIVIEMGKKETIAVPEEFTLLDERTYGKTRLMILEWQGAEA
jgi:16S rRNA (guanine966-N2)-methyltransferase